MFRRNLVPVWIGIILLSGMFLMGQDTWSAKSGSCSTHPCASIPNAVPNSCIDVGEGNFTCDCNASYFWEEIGDTCENPCDPDPCDAIDNGVADSCTGISADDFTCVCNEGFYWSDPANTCEQIVPPCAPDPCQGIPNGIPDTCEVIPGGPCAPSTDFTCDCDEGFAWDYGSNTCEGDVLDPCDPDPCQGIQNAVAGTCADAGGGDFTCSCDEGFAWNDDSNTCVDEGCIPWCDQYGLECGDDGCGGSCGVCTPPATCQFGMCVGDEFLGGLYDVTVATIVQAPPNCTMSQLLLNIALPLIRQNVMTMLIPSAAEITDSGNAYPLTINLPPPLEPVEVTLALDGEDILMDGPDVYEADTSGVGIAGVECIITGSADGIFTDIMAWPPLTGSLTIGITDVQPAPGGTCNPIYLRAPTGDCDLIVNLTGSPQ